MLDTHALLWWMEDSPRMPDNVKALISDESSIIVLSTATAWEIAIKVSKNKLTLADDPIRLGLACGFVSLDIAVKHTELIKTLPHHHSDPFDRMLVAQAMHEDLTLITRDSKVRLYDIATHWAND